MSKAKTLAGTVSTGGVLADGTVSAAEVSGLATVATSGAYADLSGKPTLPAGDVVGTTDAQTLTNKTIDIANNTLTGVQPTLVSGTNIKTIGGQSVLGSGDLAVGSSITAVASGSISLGAFVVVNTDGTVSQVSGSSEIVFASSNTEQIQVAYDSVNGKIVVVYTDGSDSDRGKAVVGSVSGTGITYGSPANFSAGASAYGSSICFDSVNQKFVIFYKGSSGSGSFGNAVVATVSGTSISFGTPVVYNSGASWYNRCVYDVASGKALVFYNEGIGDSAGYGRAGTVSGTSISFGSAALLLGGSNVRYLGCGYDVAAAKTIVGFCDVNTGRNAAVVVASVSGSTISYGTKATTSQGNNTANDFTYDPVSQQMVYGFTSNGPLKARMVTISGTTATVNSGGDISSGTVNDSFGIAYDTSLQKVVVSYGESSGATGQIKVGTVSGTSITFGTASQFNTNTQYVSSVYAANSSSVVVVYRDAANSSYGTSLSVVGGGLTNLTATNYIGFSGAAYTNGQTATIQVVGSTNSNQSSLTPGLPYYLTPSGGLSLSAGSPSVLAGTAVASTKIIIKG
jgi:hypothetical protein